MCEVYNAYDSKLVGIFPNRTKAENWITRRAAQWNYCIFRQWSMDGWDFFDVGPRVFKIKSQN